MRLKIFLLLSTLFACTEIPDSELQLQPTEMKVRVIDENYENVVGADVYIFRDPISFRTRTGFVDTQVTNEEGFALFTDLEPYNYFIYATHSEGSNLYDNSESYYILYDYLTENAVTTITVKTDFLRDSDPELAVLDGIDFMPMNLNQYYTGAAYDTLWADLMIIQDYDWYLDFSEQTVIARDEYLTFEGKPKYGEIQLSSYPYDYNTFDDPEFDLTSLELYYEDPDDPDTHTYTLLIKFFTDESDFDNRELIYSYEEYPVGQTFEEEISLEYSLDDAGYQEIPYPVTLDVSETYYLKYNYKILLNVSWK